MPSFYFNYRCEESLGFGRSPISALTPVPATTSLREAALEVRRRTTMRALSDDGLTVLKHRYFFLIYDKRLAGTARLASEYVARHWGGILASATTEGGP